MNIVIPFDGEGEEELRFALRSIDMNFQHDNVYLVSVKVPDWIKMSSSSHKKTFTNTTKTQIFSTKSSPQ